MQSSSFSFRIISAKKTRDYRLSWDLCVCTLLSCALLKPPLSQWKRLLITAGQRKFGTASLLGLAGLVALCCGMCLLGREYPRKSNPGRAVVISLLIVLLDRDGARVVHTLSDATGEPRPMDVTRWFAGVVLVSCLAESPQ